MVESVTYSHQPVMVQEVLELLQVGPGRRYVDGTVGGGGHAAALLAAAPGLMVLGIDCDEDAVAAATRRLAEFGPRAQVVRGVFSSLAVLARELGWQEVDGVLLDVGVSSYQFDTPGRGFSFRYDAPLDMRMDRRRPVTAATILNRASEQELTRIFRDFGEEPGARRLARAVVQRREVRPWERTGEFAALAESLISRQSSRGLPPATRPFQALRLAVNSEQEELAQGLRSAVSLLRPGGRLVVISFHSLEDRLVKQFLREQAAPCVCPPKLPVCACGRRATLQILTRKPLQPTAAEVAGNARSASAKLRAAEKLVSVPAAARR